MAKTLFDYEIEGIERQTADQSLAFYLPENGPENAEPDEDDEHIERLARNIRKLLALGRTDAAVQLAVYLGEVLADQERNSHLFWHLGERAAAVRHKSAEATWGSREDRQARKAERRNLFKQLRPQFDTDQKAYEATARQCDVSWRTIRRAVTGH